jgi:hypothetical protein
LRLPDGSSLIVPNPPVFSDKPGRIEPHGRLTFFVEAAGVIQSCKSVASLHPTYAPMSPRRLLATFTVSRSHGRAKSGEQRLGAPGAHVQGVDIYRYLIHTERHGPPDA